jgi:hypothetical protein
MKRQTMKHAVIVALTVFASCAYAGILDEVAVTYSSKKNLASVYQTGEIVVNPKILGYDESSRRFIIYHEKAHLLLDHFKRKKTEPIISLEREADLLSIDMLKEDGFDPCEAVVPVLSTRGSWSTAYNPQTHPSREELKKNACTGQ